VAAAVEVDAATLLAAVAARSAGSAPSRRTRRRRADSAIVAIVAGEVAAFLPSEAMRAQIREAPLVEGLVLQEAEREVPQDSLMAGPVSPALS
jgi:hypothetical protein